MANKLVSIIQSGSNNYLTPSLSFNGPATDSMSAGIIGAFTNTTGVSPATGAGAVNAQGSPNMTVAITGGVFYVTATPSGGTAQVFRVTQDVSENVTINANATGATVYDFIYLQLDTTKLNNPAVNGLDVASFITSRSTTVYSATGANNGNSNGAVAGLLLAVVTVANGAASIANASITDARVRTQDTLPTALSAMVNPYKFHVHLAAGQVMSAGATAVIKCDTKDYDTGSNVDIVTNKGRFTAPVAGFYQFNARIGVLSAASGNRIIVILFKNGVEVSRGADLEQGITGNDLGGTITDCIQLSANDYVELAMFSSAALTSASNLSAYLSGFLVSTT